MMHRKLQIWWQFLYFPLIFSQLEKMCFESGHLYECLNLNVTEVGLNFESFYEVIEKFAFET